VWSDDDSHVAYTYEARDGAGIFWQSAHPGGLPQRLTRSLPDVEDQPDSFSPHDRVFSFVRRSGTNYEIWMLDPHRAEKTPTPFAAAPNINSFGSQFSADGNWVVYSSNDNPERKFRIYMQPYPATGNVYPLPGAEGTWPLFVTGKNPLEILYRRPVGFNVARITSATITMDPIPNMKQHHELAVRGLVSTTGRRDYDIMPNGRDLAVIVPAPGAVPPPPQFKIVLNWFTELLQRVPAK
jgi:hypothetical protein